MTKVRVEPSAHDFRIQRTFATHKERHPVQRLSIPIVLAALLITLVPLGGALAQQTPTPVPLVAPRAP